MYFHPDRANDPMKTRCITVFNKGNLIFEMLHPKEWMSDVCSAFVMVQMAMNMMGAVQCSCVPKSKLMVLQCNDII